MGGYFVGPNWGSLRSPHICGENENCPYTYIYHVHDSLGNRGQKGRGTKTNTTGIITLQIKCSTKGDPSAADEVWYWLKCVMRSG